MRRRRRKRALFAQSFEDYLQQSIEQDKEDTIKENQQKQQKQVETTFYYENEDFIDIVHQPKRLNLITVANLNTQIIEKQQQQTNLKKIDVMLIGSHRINKQKILNQKNFKRDQSASQSSSQNFDLQTRSCSINGKQTQFKFWIQNLNADEKYDFVYQVYYKVFNYFFLVYDKNDQESIEQVLKTSQKIKNQKQDDKYILHYIDISTSSNVNQVFKLQRQSENDIFTYCSALIQNNSSHIGFNKIQNQYHQAQNVFEVIVNNENTIKVC